MSAVKYNIFFHLPFVGEICLDMSCGFRISEHSRLVFVTGIWLYGTDGSSRILDLWDSGMDRKVI